MIDWLSDPSDSIASKVKGSLAGVAARQGVSRQASKIQQVENPGARIDMETFGEYYMLSRLSASA
ncbi:MULTISPECIES: hypothetical protein [unclassified Duganella]|uniref:hypothetical protein n=1 Tax=unclassified Duganella TaxID=2636909 RepID=UPI0013EE8AD7|nr:MULTISPECIES: hypothetical protein [unclassified Duganella]